MRRLVNTWLFLSCIHIKILTQIIKDPQFSANIQETLIEENKLNKPTAIGK